ncbi:MAG: RlmE family RNA methyltransferase [Casimicrobiaceae bacterium]|nr:RlmE family RNA methyltransferase [Casimicrobiaceae bacterium]MCX8097863.1 RlmE family RNA methyltransferase [Casimicrobiaceae bacterium]MDW8311346.1 RlmE family RNA methyltransferase [Burkholderiales bacterium]
MRQVRRRRQKSKRSWLAEHLSDPFVQRARREGYRSRAAYKLLEIDDKDHLFRPGSVIVDLGAAPGSWCQVARQRTRGQARIVAIDRLPIEPLEGVEFIRGDFSEPDVLAQLERLLGNAAVDLVLSDMLPDMTGVPAIDAPRALHLAELATEFALAHLKPEGRLLIKAYQGPGFPELVRRLKRDFVKVASRKPEASRNRSAEIYLLASTRRDST